MALSKPVIVGLCGYGRCGKDSTAGILGRLYGYEKRAFADKVREFAEAVDAYLPEIGETYTQIVKRMGYEAAKEKHQCVRDYLVKIGHCARTVFYDSIWIDMALERDRPRLLAISDVRYPNEADRIRALGGVVWRITRPGCVPKHKTEAESIPKVRCDAEISNDGTFADLEIEVKRLLGV